MANRLKQRLAQSKDLLKRLVWRGKEPKVDDELDETRLREIRDLLLGEQTSRVLVRIMHDSVDSVRYVTTLLKDCNADVRCNVAYALADAAENTVDISIAIPELGNRLGDEDARVRSNAARALANAAQNGNWQVRGVITKAVFEFVDSKWFTAQANSNTRIYEWLLNKLDEIMQVVRKAEREEAA